MSGSRVTELLLVGALVSVGCRSQNTHEASTTTDDASVTNQSQLFEPRQDLGRGGGPPSQSASYDDGRDRVAKARCDRMASCAELGGKGAYTSYDKCLQAEKARVDGWWGGACKSLSAESLKSCMADVAGPFCPGSLDRTLVSNPAVGPCAAPNVCAGK